LLARGIQMRRLTALVRLLFKPRLRYTPEHDPTLPFTPEEFARLIRSRKPEDMRALAEGLSCRSIAGYSTDRAAY
jgi:hypothetical protein